MTIRKKMKEPGTQLRVGLVFLLLASLWKWFLDPNSFLSVDLNDGVIGLLYGISIGFMLLGIWRNSRPEL